MAPMLAGLEVPGEVRGKLLEIVESRRIRGKEERLARRSGKAGIAAKRQVNLIFAGKTVADIAGEAAIEAGVVDTLAVGMEVGARGGIVEASKKTANLSAAASGGETAAFSEEINFRNARRAAMADDLDDA